MARYLEGICKRKEILKNYNRFSEAITQIKGNLSICIRDFVLDIPNENIKDLTNYLDVGTVDNIEVTDKDFIAKGFYEFGELGGIHTTLYFRDVGNNKNSFAEAKILCMGSPEIYTDKNMEIIKKAIYPIKITKDGII